MTNMCLKRLLITLVTAVLLFSCITTNADTTGTLNCTISEFVSESDGELYLTISGEAKGSVSVFVYNSSVKPTEFSSVNMPVAFMQYDLKGGLTLFEYKIPLPSDLESGSYNINVVAKDGSYKLVENYFYFNNAGAESAIVAVNDAITDGASAIKDALYENADLLLITQSDLNTYGTFVSDLLFSRKNADGNHVQYKTAADLMKAYSEAKAIYNVENRGSDKTMEEAIAENASALGISLASDYQTNLTDSAKAELLSLLENDNSWQTRSYADMYKELAALASVKTAESWSALKAVVTDKYKDIINIDTSDYSKILDDIFAEMITYNFNSFEDISENFDLAVNALDSDNSSSASSSGSGRPGGSGSGSGMSVVGGMISNMVGDIPETDNTQNPASKFIDLPDNHWAAKEINYLVEKNVFTGYPDGTFGGNKYITRAEFATILAKAFSLSGDAQLPFADVGPDKWFNAYVSACYSNGIINGTSASTFSPDATITREDASVMICRVLSDVIATADGEVSFVDANEISDYALNAINALYNAKLINGVGDNKFAPKVCIDRQSAAKLIYDAVMIKN